PNWDKYLNNYQSEININNNNNSNNNKNINNFSDELNINIENKTDLQLRDLNLKPIWLEFGIPELVHSKITSNIRETTKFSEIFIVSEYIHDILEFFYQDTKLCSDELIKLNINISSFKSQYLIMEYLFYNLLHLPKPNKH